MTREYSKLIIQFGNLKELNKVMKTHCLLYGFDSNGFVYMDASPVFVDKFGILKNPSMYSEFTNLLFNSPELTSFGTKFAKTTTTYEFMADELYLVNPAKEVDLSLPRFDFDNNVPETMYNGLFKNSKFDFILENYNGFSYTYLTESEISQLNEKYCILVGGEVWISKKIIDVSKSVRVSYTIFNLPNDESLKYMLIKCIEKDIDIYTLVAYVPYK